jgi:ABC-type lipoprotein export system ATPase subunit
MLSFVNVTKSFTLDDETSISPVRDVTLQVQQGEFIMVVGRSGTGKTTLLNLAAGLVNPTSGRVTMEGADLRSMSQKQLSLLRNRKIGFVFQFPSLIPALTVIENVTLPSIFSGGTSDGVTSRAEGLLESLGLSKRVNAYPRQLSAGETKRVVIARSLINEPKLILADEPTSDLDDRTENEVMGILREINSRGVTFVMVTHSVQLASFATRAFEMADGVLSKLTRPAT